MTDPAKNMLCINYRYASLGELHQEQYVQQVQGNHHSGIEGDGSGWSGWCGVDTSFVFDEVGGCVV